MPLRKTKPNCRSPGGEEGEQVERRGYLPHAAEVMLDQKIAVVTERLGLDHRIDIGVIAFAVFIHPARCRARAAKQTEFH